MRHAYSLATLLAAGTNVRLSRVALGGHEYLPNGNSRGFNEDFAKAITPGHSFPGFGGAQRKAIKASTTKDTKEVHSFSESFLLNLLGSATNEVSEWQTYQLRLRQKKTVLASSADGGLELALLFSGW